MITSTKVTFIYISIDGSVEITNMWSYALTSPYTLVTLCLLVNVKTSGGRLIGIVRVRSKAADFVCLNFILVPYWVLIYFHLHLLSFNRKL
jgi:hypothetical protein